MRLFKKTILITVFAAAGAGLFLTSSAKAAVLDIVFQNEPSPLFQEGDIKPCDSVTRWIKASNTSGQIQPLAIEAINFPNPIPSDDLSRALTILIKEGAATLYGPKTLAEFYQAGETSLSDVGIGDTAQYDIIVSFPCDKENEWQEKTTGFDIAVHFQGDGQDGGGNGSINTTIISNGGGGGGGPLPPSDAYENWLNQQGPAGEVKGENIFVPPSGPGGGEVKGASIKLPGTGFRLSELFILLAAIFTLFVLRRILQKYSQAN